MSINLNKRLLVAAVSALLSTASFALGTLHGDYYILDKDHADVDQDINGIVPGLVETTLGANGLPVATSYGMGAGSGIFKDVDSITHEVLWWTAGNRGHGDVTHEKSQDDAAPIDFPSNFFPDGHVNNANGFRAVHWQATFDMANSGSISMDMGADDDAWAFIDGQLFIDLGGVHGLSYSSYTTQMLGAGTHKLDVFFADRCQVQSGIKFDPKIEVNAVPEPASMSVLGLGALAMFRRRKA